MAIFAKIWTDIFNDDWFQSLNCTQRGIWLQLIVYAKLSGDTGDIFVKSMTFLSQVVGSDRRSLTKMLSIARNKNAILLKQKGDNFVITIKNYQKWQGLKGGGKSSRTSKFPNPDVQNSHQSRVERVDRNGVGEKCFTDRPPKPEHGNWVWYENIGQWIPCGD